MGQLKAVAFDWGGVIIDEPSKDLQKYCALKLEAKNFDLACEIIWESMTDFQNKAITEWNIWERVCLEADGNLKAIPENSLWAEAVRAVFKFKQEIMNHIKTLKSLGYKTAFLSNTETAAAKYFYELELNKLFDVSILSCEVGISKPNPKIYTKLIDHLNFKPHEIAFLDDREENIIGANEAGIKGYLFSNSNNYLKWFEENK